MENQVNTTIYYADINKETNIVQGFYCKEIHGDNIPSGAIAITEELWQHLLSMGQAKVNIDSLAAMPTNLEDDSIFGISSEHCFAAFIPEPVEQEPLPPSEVDLLKKEVEELKELVQSVLNTRNEQS